MPETDKNAPFESASELREAHARLLEALDLEIGQDVSVAGETAALARLEAEVRRFLERGAATGVYLDEVKERTACQVLLDYWASSLSQAGRPTESARLARFDGEQLPDLKDKPCPYVGLEAFHDRDRTFFFGREDDIATLLAQVRDCPLTVVLGASGSGKSSLVLGGLLPALAAGGTPALRILLPFAPGRSVLTALTAAVSTLSPLKGDPGAPPALLTIDQFEEVFTLASAEDRDALARSLAGLLEAGHHVLLTVREEFRSRIVELTALAPWLGKAWYSMRPMGYDELRAVVERPAALVNLQFQPGIVDDLVKRMLGQPAALPLLQFTLRRLWDERDRNRITWEVYRRIGDPLSALKASADRFYEELAPETQNEVRRILLELVRVDDLLEAYRQPVLKSDLLKVGKANTEEALRLLNTNDYIRLSPDADPVVEIKHEALIRNWPLFVGWIDQKRRERRQRLALGEAARRWAGNNNPEGLLTGWQLQEAKSYTDLPDLEKEFVAASAAAVDSMQREKEETLQREIEQAKGLAAAKKKILYGTRAALILVIVAATGIGAAAYHFWEKSEALNDYARQLEEKGTIQERNAVALQKYNADLEEKYADLEKRYDKLQLTFVEGVEKIVAPDSRQFAKPVTIFLHISAEGQRQRVAEIADLLRKKGIIVPGIQRISPPVTRSSVRYFRQEDEPRAQEIAQLLDDLLGVPVPLTSIKGYEGRVPPSQYEIWFAPDALDSLVKPKGLP